MILQINKEGRVTFKNASGAVITAAAGLVVPGGDKENLRCEKNNTTKIEAQGGEIITRNSYGDVAIYSQKPCKEISGVYESCLQRMY